MVENNKILTVSYGTFSCTLEGFDDSFGTMKAIAEYFRDLAADDRYFGAEPPQPDAERLARIAEREIARQVEARSDDQGIVLRASEYQTSAALTAASAAIAQTQTAPEQPVVQVEDAVAPAPAISPEPAVSRETAIPEPEIEEPAAGDGVADGGIDADIMVEPPVEPEAADMQVEPEMPVAEPAPEPVAEPEIEADHVATEPAANSIAAKLQRIRAVVSKTPADDADADAEDDAATQDIVTETVSDLSMALDEDDAIAGTQNEPFEVAADQELADAFARFDAQSADTDDDKDYDENYDDAAIDDDDVLSFLAAVQDDDATDAQDDADTVAQDDAEQAGQADAEIGDIAEDDAADALTAIGVNDDKLDDIDADEDATQYDAGDDDRLFTDLAGDDAADAGAGDDYDSADDEELVNILGDDDSDGDTADRRESSLSEDEEADLLRELAEVESDLDDDLDLLQDDDDAQPDDGDMHGAAILQGSEEPDDDVSRLMAAADEKLDAAESSSSRETYSHLRAAVAAAEAERSAGGDLGDGNADDAYREDLADAVGPADTNAAPSLRPGRPPAEDRPAPLKLVAEQRVDIDAPKNVRGPVRPRRVSASELEAALPVDDAEQQGGFAEYAQRMGATELPDLLEAAASYMSFIEGRDQFSRPQLMSKVRQLESQEFSREDGLRSFGQLLRQGKIQRKGGGRFAAAGNIGFRPDEREAG